MPASAASAPAAPSDLPWRILWLLGLYRLLVPLMLVCLQRLPGASWPPATMRPGLFRAACLAYLAAAVLLIGLQQLKGVRRHALALASACVDCAALALILYACGGVASGLGVLLVPPVMALTLLAQRATFLIAAFATASVFLQQVLARGTEGLPGDYAATALLGCVLFAVALLASPSTYRRHENEARVRRREVDPADIAQLSQYIVQHLRESILVVDPQKQIRLINESAAQMLGSSNARPGTLLEEVSPPLLQRLEGWRQGGGAGAGVRSADPTFVSEDGARKLRAHFAPLAAVVTPATPVLVFLEDPSVLAEKIQQTKLAALARLSASIAHEVRNPVGAMSHAGQLLAESSLSEEDRKLTQIIRTNAERVSAIIDNVLRLSRGETRLERLSLPVWTQEFCQEFCETMQWPRSRLRITAPAVGGTEVRADPGQLRQILWNLCENALKHAIQDRPEGLIELRYGRLTPSRRPFLEVRDRGPGVAPEHVERIFEPFFSPRRGTGLGLFLAHELAQTNGATLLYQARPGGGSIFRIVFADPQRWEARSA